MIKSSSMVNINLSLEHGCWVTTPSNEIVLSEVFLKTKHIILIFSITGGSSFLGYARMTSTPSETSFTDCPFVASDGRPFQGKKFGVEWIRRIDIPFPEFSWERNALDDDRPLKFSRDGKEISRAPAVSLCSLMDQRELNFRLKNGLEIPDNFATQPLKLQKIPSNRRPSPPPPPPMSEIRSTEPWSISAPTAVRTILDPMKNPISLSKRAEWMILSSGGVPWIGFDVTSMTYNEYINAHSRLIDGEEETESGKSLTVPQWQSVVREFCDLEK